MARGRLAPAALAFALALAGVVAPGLALAPARAGADRCEVDRGSPDPGTVPYAQTRLAYPRVHEVATGAGVTVAVIDSGMDRQQPQVRMVQVVRPTNVLGGGYAPQDVSDCESHGHGTGVAALVAAPSVPDVGFEGLAPGVTIMPIKAYDSDDADLTGPATLAAAVDAAVRAGAAVINMSETNPSDDPILRTAVKEAGRAGVVVVAASGNQTPDGAQAGYPAEWADDGPAFAHVLAVGAVDSHDAAASFSVPGPWVGICAPGEAMRFPNPVDGYTEDSGTSFAAPLVAATAALVRQTHRGLSAAEVVSRIEATADPTGRARPDLACGHGIVNPYLAVTSLRDDAASPAPSPAPREVAAPRRPAPPDRTLQHLAYAVGLGLLGLAALVAVATAAWRRTAEERRRPGPA